MVVGGGDFSLGFRIGAENAKSTLPDGAANAHHHFPYARRVRRGWRLNPDGHWISDHEDERLWEVFCAECGDMDGPVENQTEMVQRLRGPYSHEHKAKHTARKHFDEN